MPKNKPKTIRQERSAESSTTRDVGLGVYDVHRPKATVIEPM